MNFKFGTHIHRIDRNKSPLKFFRKSSRGLSQGLQKIFRAPIYRAHRVVIFAIAQLSCCHQKVKRLKRHDIFIPPLTRKPYQQRFTLFEVAYWPAMTLGGAAQVAAAHYPNERTLEPAVCSYNRPTYAPCQPHYGFHCAMFSGNDSLFLVESITRY